MRNGYLFCIVTSFIFTPVADPVGGGGGGEFAPKTFFGQLGSENFIMHVCFVLFCVGLVLVIVQKYVYVHWLYV